MNVLIEHDFYWEKKNPVTIAGKLEREPGMITVAEDRESGWIVHDPHDLVQEAKSSAHPEEDSVLTLKDSRVLALGELKYFGIEEVGPQQHALMYKIPTV